MPGPRRIVRIRTKVLPAEGGTGSSDRSPQAKTKLQSIKAV